MNASPATTQVDSWHPPPETFAIGGDDVHVWCACLDQTTERVRSLLGTLAADEKTRAERFHFRRDREHFIAARGLLRILLGRYLDTEPRRLCFRYNPYGKPSLAEGAGADALRFNLSHSHGLLLVAVARGREVGVDVERIRPDLADEQIARRYFSPSEVAVLCGLPKHLRLQAFFNCWTRKEAYVKARGEGLSLPLDQFDVSLAPGEPAVLLQSRGDLHGASHWSLRELMPAPGYAAALAVEGSHCRLKCWRYRDQPAPAALPAPF